MRCYSLIMTLVFAECGAACGQPHHESAPDVPVKEIERSYGRLITSGNHPTPDQHGTGERMGFFLDPAGTIWGLPILIASEGQLLVCSPRTLSTARVTGTYPAGSSLIGTTNEPTGWRSGTGRLELVMRNVSGTITWQTVEGALPSPPPFCEAPPFPGPSQRLEYYRLAPVSDQQPMAEHRSLTIAAQ